MYIYIIIYIEYISLITLRLMSINFRLETYHNEYQTKKHMMAMFGKQTQPEVYGYNGSCWAPKIMLWLVLDDRGHLRGRSSSGMGLFQELNDVETLSIHQKNMMDGSMSRL